MKSIWRRRGKKKTLGGTDAMILSHPIRFLLMLCLIFSAGQSALAQQDLDWGEFSDEIDRLRTLTDQQLREESNQVHRSLEDYQDRVLKSFAFMDLGVGVFGGVLFGKGLQKNIRVGMVAGCGLMVVSVLMYVFHRRQHNQEIEWLHEQAQTFEAAVPTIQSELEIYLKPLLDYLSQAQIYLEIPVNYHPDGGFKMVWHKSTDLLPVIYDAPTYVYQSYQHAGREWVKKYVPVPEEHLAAFRSALFLKLLQGVGGDDFATSCAKQYYDGRLTDSTAVQDLVKQTLNQSIRLDRVLLIGLSVLSEFESLDLKFAPDVFPEESRWVNYRIYVSQVLSPAVSESSSDALPPLLIPLTVQ